MPLEVVLAHPEVQQEPCSPHARHVFGSKHTEVLPDSEVGVDQVGVQVFQPAFVHKLTVGQQAADGAQAEALDVALNLPDPLPGAGVAPLGHHLEQDGRATPWWTTAWPAH